MDSDLESALSLHERSVYKHLFRKVDIRNKTFVTKAEAMSFFSDSGIPLLFLEEIWQTVDQGAKGYITEIEFYMALKLIACTQHGVEATEDILSTQVPLPQFQNTDIAPMTSSERQSYIQLFESCQPINGLVPPEQATEVFQRSGLSAEKLGKIWSLADTRRSGSLNKTEFIIAMYYISRLVSNPTLVLPTTLPSQVYAEATGNFSHTIRRRSPYSPTMQPASPSLIQQRSPVMSKVVSSPLVQSITPYSPLVQQNSSSDLSSLISTQEKDRYKTYFEQLDSDGNGFIEADEAVYFFNHSHLPNQDLGMIWEIADKRHLGKLDLHDFCVAMHLIQMRKRGENIEQYLHQQPNSLLEQQLTELRHQIQVETQRAQSAQLQQRAEIEAIQDLQDQIMKVKQELNRAKTKVEDAQQELERQKTTSKSRSYATSIPSSPNVPNLTPALSFASTMSPQSETGSSVFDPFAGFNKVNTVSSPAITQSKKVTSSKQGDPFDLSAFDVLSVKQVQPSSSIKDDLASLFAPVPSDTSKHTDVRSDFDSVFL